MTSPIPNPIVKMNNITDEEVAEYDHEWSLPNYELYKDTSIPRRFVIFAIDEEDLSYLMKPGALRFDSYEQAETFIREECQCATCCELIERGVNPRCTSCYSLMCIWSERRLSRDLNGAWIRQMDKISRRQYDPGYKKIRRR